MGPNRATTLGNMILMENPVENVPIHVQLVSFNTLNFIKCWKNQINQGSRARLFIEDKKLISFINWLVPAPALKGN